MVDNDFSFKKVKKSLEEEIDETLKKNNEKIRLKEYSDSINRIKFAHNIQENPPEKDFLRTEFHEATQKNEKGEIEHGIAIKETGPEGKTTIEFTNGIFAIDLNTDADWWFNRSCTVFPLLLDQGIRTHVDIKEGFRPEKRKVEFSYLWIAIVIIGLVMVITLVMFLLGGG